MLGDALRLGLAAGIGWTVGGAAGERAFAAIKGSALTEAQITGARITGRVTGILVLFWVVSRL